MDSKPKELVSRAISEDDAGSEASDVPVEIALGARRRAASDDESEGGDAAEPLADGENQEEYEDAEEEGVYHSRPSSAAKIAAAAGGADEQGSSEEGEYVDTAENETEEGKAGQEQRRKPLEPFEVPTSGAFYMHDDRFDEYEEKQQSKTKKRSDASEGKWLHDKFEELNVRQPTTQDNYRPRGRGPRSPRGGGRGPRGRGPRAPAPLDRPELGPGPGSGRGRGRREGRGRGPPRRDSEPRHDLDLRRPAPRRSDHEAPAPQPIDHDQYRHESQDDYEDDVDDIEDSLRAQSEEQAAQEARQSKLKPDAAAFQPSLPPDPASGAGHGDQAPQAQQPAGYQEPPRPYAMPYGPPMGYPPQYLNPGDPSTYGGAWMQSAVPPMYPTYPMPQMGMYPPADGSGYITAPLQQGYTEGAPSMGLVAPAAEGEEPARVKAGTRRYSAMAGNLTTRV